MRKYVVLTFVVLLLAFSIAQSKEPEMLLGCPLVQLKGELVLHTFAAHPNYESIEEGDTSESRWLLKLDPELSDYLWSTPIPEFYQTQFLDQRGSIDWVQLTTSPLDEEVCSLQGKKVAVEGFLGGWHSHLHTPFLLEVVRITNGQ